MLYRGHFYKRGVTKFYQKPAIGIYRDVTKVERLLTKPWIKKVWCFRYSIILQIGQFYKRGVTKPKTDAVLLSKGKQDPKACHRHLQRRDKSGKTAN